MFEKVSGVVPNASTGPDDVPECIVIKSVTTLLVNLRVIPETAPEMVEYSPAYEQVEMVTTAPAVLMVAEPYEVVFVHCAHPVCVLQRTNAIARIAIEKFFNLSLRVKISFIENKFSEHKILSELRVESNGPRP